MYPMNPLIDDIVRIAVELFSGPGSQSGNSNLALQFGEMAIKGENPDLELSDEEREEIRHRFVRLTTFPPIVSEDEISDSSHTDESIDGSWYQNIEEFSKWESIVDNWKFGSKDSRIPPSAIENIDNYTNHILENSFDPAGDPYLWKGLVVGNVQSGKTATYTGLIAKAIDVGYRVIVIMSGRMNSLRYQTESRISLQVNGMPEDERSIALDDMIQPLTSLDLDGDFDGRSAPIISPSFIASSMRGDKVCLVAVMKKHHSPIEKFARWIDEISEEFPEIRDMPFLLVDDEMDEAGPNTGGEEVTSQTTLQEQPIGPEEEMIDDPSTTNQAITNLLRKEKFRRRMYLGFTATPYAVYLHRRRDPESSQFLEYGPDIFPDNYLLVLDDPDSYCGGEIFAGRNEVVVREMSRKDDGRMEFGDEILTLPPFEGIPGICNEIPIGEFGMLIPPDPDLIPTEPEEFDDYEYAEMTPSLEKAIWDFIIAGAAREQRGDGDKPCTMMINVSTRWAVHFDVKNCIQRYLGEISEMLETPFKNRFFENLRRRWEHSFVPSILEFNGMCDGIPTDLELFGAGHSTENPTRVIAHAIGTGQERPTRTTSFEEIIPFIPGFIREISREENHRVLNYHSKDIVDFDSEPELKAIIHGGFNLGRGLTFKGMLTSYLLRGHGDMSGLMQMQRWCGYRGEEGGERILDLMRIYLPEEVRLLLQRMLTIEKKNRYTLSTYIRKSMTPAEFRTVLEQDPDTPLMSAAKQGALKEVGRILSGSTRTQRTFEFTKEEDCRLNENLIRISNFLEEISPYRFEQYNGIGDVYRDVPTDMILGLLSDWNSTETSGFRIFEIESWIKRLQDLAEARGTAMELSHWTVFIPSRSSESNISGGFVDGFDPEKTMEIAGKEFLPFSYNLDRDSTNRLRVTSSPGWPEIDRNLFFDGSSRPASHGLMLISPIIHPLNRNFPGGKYGQNNPSISYDGDVMHNAGDWPNLVSLGFWFPTTTSVNTVLIEHGG